MAELDTKDAFEGFAILELMGHRRLGGYVRQVEMFGAAMCRIDVPGPGEGEVAATQFYGGGSIYCLTPTTEAMARAVALRNQPEPVQRWELPAPKKDQTPRRCVSCGESFLPIDEHQDYCADCEETLDAEEHSVDELPI